MLYEDVQWVHESVKIFLALPVFACFAPSQFSMIHHLPSQMFRKSCLQNLSSEMTADNIKTCSAVGLKQDTQKGRCCKNAACSETCVCVCGTQTADRKRSGLFTNGDWKQMLVKARTGEKMFRKILRAQPRLSGPWPGRPIAARHPLVFGLKEALLLDGYSNVGVGSRCPGKVAESQSTHSKRKAKTFACSTGQ